MVVSGARATMGVKAGAGGEGSVEIWVVHGLGDYTQSGAGWFCLSSD